MSTRILWLPGPSGTTSYRITSGTSTGSMSTIVVVPHDTSSIYHYDPAAGMFHYDDMVGTVYTWYSVTAVSGVVDVQSSYNFQVGYSTYPIRAPAVTTGVPDAVYDNPPPPPRASVTTGGPRPPRAWAVND